MFRWLKDRKKLKKGENVKDEYGFKGKTRDFGFDDKVYHIYEEIPDIPDSIESPGPYMVVPLDIGDKKMKGKRVSFQDISDVSADSSQVEFKTLDLVDSVKTSTSGSKTNRNVPVMGIGQKTSKRGGEFTCALVGRKNTNVKSTNSHKSSAPALPARNYIKQSLSATSMENMSQSKLKSRKLLENILSDLSKSSDDIFSDHDSSDAKFSSSSSNSVDQLSETCRKTMSIDSNDTGCEYDMSSSGDSDKSSQDSYGYYLNQVEQNFILRCRVQEISNDNSVVNYRLRDPQIGDESDSDSLTTISTISQVTVHNGKNRQSSTCSSDEGTMADLSESESSSGYYDSCSVENKGSKAVIKLTNAILQNSTQRTRSSRHKMHNSKDKKSEVISVRQTKPKSKANILEEICEKYDSISESGSSDIYSRRLASEVYSPPSVRADNQSIRKAPICHRRVVETTQIYQSGGGNKNNKLLSDLIMMNYNKQVHQF